MTTDGSRLAVMEWLASTEGGLARAEARACLAQAEGDPLRAGALLRTRLPHLDPARAAAVLEQADLGRLAAERYGLEAPLLLTRDGLEQATRPEVAARRARLVAQSGARRVLDLTGGLGFDAAAFRNAGLQVTAVERDPATAVALAANCPGVDVVADDALAALPAHLARLQPGDVVFVDPARRDPAGPRDRVTGRARSERDPDRWSPPWSDIAAIPHPRVLAKVAPAFDPPLGWQAEWVSVDRQLVECAVASWPLAAHDRAAVVIAGGDITVVPAGRADAPDAVGLGAWVAESDPAIVRAGAGADLAVREGLLPVGAGSSWLTGDHASTSPALRCFLVVDELAGSTREQRRILAARGVTRATVKSRDVDVEPRQVLRSLGLSEGGGHVIVMTRRAGRTLSLLTQPAAARGR